MLIRLHYFKEPFLGVAQTPSFPPRGSRGGEVGATRVRRERSKATDQELQGGRATPRPDLLGAPRGHREPTPPDAW